MAFKQYPVEQVGPKMHVFVFSKSKQFTLQVSHEIESEHCAQFGIQPAHVLFAKAKELAGHVATQAQVALSKKYPSLQLKQLDKEEQLLQLGLQLAQVNTFVKF